VECLEAGENHRLKPVPLKIRAQQNQRSTKIKAHQNQKPPKSKATKIKATKNQSHVIQDFCGTGFSL
jgi:hypothetical protein